MGSSLKKLLFYDLFKHIYTIEKYICILEYRNCLVSAVQTAKNLFQTEPSFHTPSIENLMALKRTVLAL